MSIPAERLDQIGRRLAEIEARLASGTLAGDEFVAASRDYAELEPVAQIAAEVRAAREEIAGLQAMLEDPEMKAMAEEELEAIRTRLPEAERELALAMLPRGLVHLVADARGRAAPRARAAGVRGRRGRRLAARDWAPVRGGGDGDGLLARRVRQRG